MSATLTRPRLEARWLAKVRYSDAHQLQKALFTSPGSYLLLLEHHKVYTLGVRAKKEHVLIDPTSVGAELVETDRGGDVTYHGPGQLVGYPIMDVPHHSDAVPRFVRSIESVLIGVLNGYGITAYSDHEYPGVWVDRESPRKIAAIGVKVTRGRSMHGFALNVNTDLEMFTHIVPCGISDRGVTSMQAEGVSVTVAEVSKAVASTFSHKFGFDSFSYHGVDDASVVGQVEPAQSEAASSVSVSLTRRLAKAGVRTDSGLSIAHRKPEWLRLRANMGEEYRNLKSVMREHSLVTVCEEAGCPNIYECWASGTATFMINGDRCTRACGFCLVDTSKPLALDPGEPLRVAQAVREMGLEFAVVTAVARDDLSDGGAEGFAHTIAEIRNLVPGVGVEVLIPDCKGDPASLKLIFDERPDVLNHNIETPLRLQRAVRPSASYARSLSVLARSKEAGLTTKSGMIVGMGETLPEVLDTIVDLRNVGVEILTVGQYLRPTKRHIPVMRYYTPAEFQEIDLFASSLGFSHVEAKPMARSSYHAKAGAAAASPLRV